MPINSSRVYLVDDALVGSFGRSYPVCSMCRRSADGGGDEVPCDVYHSMVYIDSINTT